MVDPAPTDCHACAGRFLIPVVASVAASGLPRLRHSLAAVGEKKLAEEARGGREVELIRVWFELHRQYGLSDADLLRRANAGGFAGLSPNASLRLPIAEERAAEVVAKAACRVVPALP